MIKVAITGNIASGKSCVEKILQEAGYNVLDADKVGHELLKYDSDTIDNIKKLFKGIDILNTDNSLSRDKIGKIIFYDIEKKKELENILHKKIDAKTKLFFEEHKNEKIVFASIPLLFECNMDKEYNKIIFVSAPEKLRIERLIQRNKYSLDYAKKRIQSQEKEETKITKSDYIITNNSDIKNLKIQVEMILDNLVQFCHIPPLH